MKFFLQIIKHFLNLIIFLAFSGILLYYSWELAGKTYLLSGKPMGGDYFNALTYVEFFNQQLPIPPLGWLPFWNEGSPLIGGYPWLAFYLMKPMMMFFDSASTMEIFSSVSMGFFFVASLILFYIVSKNWFIAFALTLVLVVTRASYYPLMTGGFVISATAQWYLPIVLLFLYKFSEKGNFRYLVLASIFGGLSLLHHAPTSLLMIIVPSACVLFMLPISQKNIRGKILDVFWFLLLSFAIGAAGIYSVILQNFFGSGGDACQSPECWGIYPKHLQVWMSFLTPTILGFLAVFSIILKIFKRKTHLLSFLPALAGFAVFFLYSLLAYLQLINGAANVMFPTRIFWAANVFLLLIAAHLFRSIHKILPQITTFVISIMVVITTGYLIYMFPSDIHKDVVNIDPVDSYKYTIDKYKTHPITDIVPAFVPLKETNWRLDTFNPGIVHWWNYVSDIPSTRGYSAHPLGSHRDWQYFLQYSTRDPENKNEELVTNRALFLLDAFGIGYREDSIAPYPQSVLSEQNVINKEVAKARKDVSWMQFSPEIVSPIVSPTNSNTVLFIGDDEGYENFIRSIAMVNLNSFKFIPIKGPQSIDSVSDEELKHFKGVVCYRFTGGNFAKLTTFAKNGGFVFIETGSLKNPLTSNLSELFPMNTLSNSETQGTWEKATDSTSELTNNVDIKSFSPLKYERGPWKISSTSQSNLRSWAKPILERENTVLVADGTLEKGRIIWSGMNLMYHTVTYNNFEEAKFLRNILSPISTSPTEKPTYTIERTDPRIIKVTGNNFNGIYFKENYDSGWKASEFNKNLKIYQAGLDFMYVPLDHDKTHEIKLSFNGNVIQWMIFVLMIISLLLTILYLFIPHPFHMLKNRTHHHVKHSIGKKISSWWQREEE